MLQGAIRETAKNLFPTIKTNAEFYNVDPALIMAMIYQESGYNKKAVSSVGAIGLMQIMPDTGRDIAKNLKVENFTVNGLYDSALNIKFGSYYISRQLVSFQTINLALAAYNAGPGTVQDHLKTGRTLPEETRNYVKNILSFLPEFMTLIKEFEGEKYGSVIEAAKAFKGRQYKINHCAIAVNEVLLSCGIDVKRQYGVENTAWVPEYEDQAGELIQWKDRKPGDLVFLYYNPSFNDFEHIGIIAENTNEMYHVSTAHGYLFALTGIPIQDIMRVRRVKAEVVLKKNIVKLFAHDGKLKVYVNGGIALALDQCEFGSLEIQTVFKG